MTKLTGIDRVSGEQREIEVSIGNVQPLASFFVEFTGDIQGAVRIYTPKGKAVWYVPFDGNALLPMEEAAMEELEKQFAEWEKSHAN